jgi:uncharacterized NAD-dependent epimerase/dehydratase family protein
MNTRPREDSTRAVILAEGAFGVLGSKTAACIIRYRPQDVVAVIDGEKAGMTSGAVIGTGGDIPVVSSLDDAITHRPNTLIIGIAPRGGGLPDDWRPLITSAIGRGLDIVSGLHFFISDDPEFSKAARAKGVKIVDLRKVPSDIGISTCKAADAKGSIVLTVGTDCNVGKMTASMELTLEARRRGFDAEMIATGQTGIYLTGHGLAIDRVVSDYVAGAAERLVVEADAPGRWLIMEGQGSLTHPAYSGVALGILHGTMPDCLVLCHQPSRRVVSGYDRALPAIKDVIELHERLAQYVKPAPVVGLALNSFDLSDDDARMACSDIEKETGLPAVDPVRNGAGRLVEAIDEYLAGRSPSVGTGS